MPDNVLDLAHREGEVGRVGSVGEEVATLVNVVNRVVQDSGMEDSEIEVF